MTLIMETLLGMVAEIETAMLDMTTDATLDDVAEHMEWSPSRVLNVLVWGKDNGYVIAARLDMTSTLYAMSIIFATATDGE